MELLIALIIISLLALLDVAALRDGVESSSGFTDAQLHGTAPLDTVWR